MCREGDLGTDGRIILKERNRVLKCELDSAIIIGSGLHPF
jgi:hypothetical protein